MTNEEEDKLLNSMTDVEAQRYFEENYYIDPDLINKGLFTQESQLGVKPDGSFGTINKFGVSGSGLLFILEKMKDTPRDELTEEDINETISQAAFLVQKQLCPLCYTSIFFRDNSYKCVCNKFNIDFSKDIKPQFKVLSIRYTGKIIYNFYLYLSKEDKNK